MNKNKGFLKDGQGDNSLIRLMSIISLVVAIIITMISVIKGTSVDSFMLLSWLGFAFFPKVMQKQIESKLDLSTNKETTEIQPPEEHIDTN